MSFRTKLQREANRLDEQIYDAVWRCKQIANGVIGAADAGRHDLLQAVEHLGRARYIVRQMMHREDIEGTE